MRNLATFLALLVLFTCGPTLGEDLAAATIIPLHDHPDTVRYDAVQGKATQIATMLCQEQPNLPECVELRALTRDD